MGHLASPGLVPATSCSRIDAMHLRVTLAREVSDTAAQCLLLWQYGSFTPAGAMSHRADMWRSNAVRDNFLTLAKPAGLHISTDLGLAWNINFPLSLNNVSNSFSVTGHSLPFP